MSLPADLHVRIPESLSWLAPLEVDGLIRVGGEADGGYVVPAGLLRNAEVLVSMGLGHNWQFEKDVKALNRGVRIHVYDHTVSDRLFARQLLAEVAGLVAGRTSLATVRRRRLRLNDYRAFFGTEATHFRERIHDRCDSHSVDIPTVLARAGTGRVFVKMDIEGGEYRVLEEVLSYADRILGLAVEFHDVGPLRPVFERVLEASRGRFEIVHVHANNFAPTYRDGFPEACEVTLARRDLVQGTKRRRTLPLADLDRPNDPRSPDYRLLFD
ncbi:hypothetical protein [Luteitalea sp.]|uniref:hypothetical protein n=1 Tax=Luteitalea sp. TaxID=2004800 RepID=UPI0025BBBFAC|nr:hypothetical protein [Luteitalea sp.]